MRRLGPEMLSGLTILLVCLVIVVPVPFAVDAGRFLVPVWTWATLALLYFAAVLACVAATPRTRRAVAGCLLQTALAAALVLTVPGAGWLPIVLVFGAALSAYVAPAWTTVVVVVTNTAALGVAGALGGQGQGALESALGAGLYLLLQVSAVLVSVALRHERSMRTELSAVHAELAAAAVLQDEAARASERLRISRELHDLVGHQLTVLALELESALHREPDAAREHVARARTVARELLDDVRHTVGDLRRRAPDLRAALEAVAAAVPRPRVEVSVADDVVADEEQTAALVRVVQEVVTNAVRHAEMATVLRLAVTSRAGRLTLVAHDDGLTSGEVRLGNGLRGIRERTRALGGEATFDASAGFRVEAHLAARSAS